MQSDMLTTGLGSGLKELAMGRPKLTAVLKIISVNDFT